MAAIRSFTILPTLPAATSPSLPATSSVAPESKAPTPPVTFESKDSYKTIAPSVTLNLMEERNAILKIVASNILNDVKEIPPESSVDWKDHDFFVKQLRDPANHRPILDLKQEMQAWSVEKGYQRYNPKTGETTPVLGPLPERGRAKPEKKHTKKTAFTMMGLHQTYFHPSLQLPNGNVVNQRRIALIFDLKACDPKGEKYCFPGNAFTNGRFWRDMRPTANRFRSIGFQGIRDLQDIYAKANMTIEFHNEILVGASKEGFVGLGVPDDTLEDKVNAITKKLFYRKELQLDLPIFILKPGQPLKLYTRSEQRKDIVNLAQTKTKISIHLINALNFFNPKYLENELFLVKEGDCLVLAASKGDLKKLRYYIEEVCNFPLNEIPLINPLFAAIQSDSLPCFKYLLEKDPTLLNDNKFLPKIIGAASISSFNILSFLYQEYRENFIKVVKTPPENFYLNKRLTTDEAIDPRCIRLLLSAGEKLNYETALDPQYKKNPVRLQQIRNVISDLLEFTENDEQALQLFKFLEHPLTFCRVDNHPLIFWLVQKNYPKSLDYLLSNDFISSHLRGMSEGTMPVSLEDFAVENGRTECLKILLTYRTISLPYHYKMFMRSALEKGHKDCHDAIATAVFAEEDKETKQAIAKEYAANKKRALTTLDRPSIFQKPTLGPAVESENIPAPLTKRAKITISGEPT